MPRRGGRILVTMLLMLAACGGGAPTYELTGRTMGTQFSVQIAGSTSGGERAKLQQEIEGALATVEQQMSTYLLQSDISKFNASPSTGWIAVSASTCHAVEVAEDVSELSNGAFDVTVGSLVNLWGFGPDPVQVKPPPDSAISAALERVGYRRLHTDCAQPALRKDSPDVYVDLSAYAKGFGADRVAELLDFRGIRNYLVEIGGELRLRGRDVDGELWAVAIEAPADNGRTLSRIVKLTDTAMATSGDYRNFFEYEGRRYSHTIDPHTGRPTTHNLASVTVISETAALADAMATALLVLGPDEGFDLAAREQIAAYFQLRTGNGFEERTTPAFRAFDEPPIIER
ncbi:MAG TPA: FAD:protein FMN transferase [Woeseiaceae bacterium]|nr:FAD:protein FMN transferase [Woeseiaceae bacterium]